MDLHKSLQIELKIYLIKISKISRISNFSSYNCQKTVQICQMLMIFKPYIIINKASKQQIAKITTTSKADL